MLGGDHHGVHPNGSAVFVILHGDLGLAVGAQIVHQALLADLGQAHGHLLGQGNGQGHQLRGLVAGIAEHHALVAGAVVQLLIGVLLGLQALVHAHGDVAGLLVDVGDDGAGVAVEAVLGPVIADIQHHLAGDLWDIHIAVGGDLAHDVDQARGGAGLAGHAAIGVLLQDGVQNGVADLVADFVGMPLGDGFGGKQSSCHDFSCSFVKKICVVRAPLPTRSMKNARSDFRRIVLENCSSSVEGRARDYHFRTQHTSDLAPCLAGCRGFIGPIPQPLSIRYELVGDYSAISAY